MPQFRLRAGTWVDGGFARPGGDQGAELARFNNTYYVNRFVSDC